MKAGRPAYKSFKSSISDMIIFQYSKDNRQGIVRLKMNIKRNYGLTLSKKTIYRYMKLHNIQSVIRRKKRRYSKVQHHAIPNLIKRNFKASAPNEKWSIDVTYVHTTGGIEYLCAIKDMYDKSIVSYNYSRFNNNELVITALADAINKVPNSSRNGLIIHSDQGNQFTSLAYGLRLKQNGIIHSVSYRGSCVDNVPIESWFSALKTECIYLNSKLDRKRTRDLIDNYIEYYNYERFQEQLNELAPVEFRRLALA